MQVNKLGFETSFPIDFFIDLNNLSKRKKFNCYGEPYSATETFITNFCKIWDCSFCHGCTKGVFVFKKLGFVLKFNTADNRANCTEEYEAYNCAKKYGVERICAPVDIFYTAPNGEKFYIQPFAHIFEDYEVYATIEEMFRKKKFCERKIQQYSDSFAFSGGLSTVFWKRCVQYYGWKFMQKVQEWAEECKVEDLHDGNVGVVGNNRPVLIDYGGAYFL